MDFADDQADLGVLGYLAGRRAGDGVPYFDASFLDHARGPILAGALGLRGMGAAMAASGSVALYYVEGVTPKPPAAFGKIENSKLEKVSIDRKQLDELYEKYPGADAEIVALGCPHCSLSELNRIAELLDGKKVKKELWVCTARKIANAHPELVARIERSGAKIICDTCMVVSPVMEQYGLVMVNSGKAFAYVPDMCGAAVRLGTTEECIRMATGG